MMSEKIGPQHLRRKAMLYVRQSSPHQVMHNRESGALQYAMTDRLKGFGFSRIEVADEDLGRSAAGAFARAGFERMVAEVCLGKVGAVAAREVSRFARNSRDWQQFVEMCRVVDTVLIDQDTVYAPAPEQRPPPARPQGQHVVMENSPLVQRPLQPICSAARFVVQHAEPTVITSFLSKLPDIIFVLQIAFSCSNRPTFAFHRGSSPASPGQVDFIASSFNIR